MKKTIVLIMLLFLVSLSFFLSIFYFADPQHRKEKIEEYKHKVEKRRPQ